MKKYPPTLTYNNSTTSHHLFLKFWKMESRIQILNLYILLHHALQFVATEEEHLQSEALHRGLNSGKRRHEERGKWMCCNIGDDNDTCIVVAILSRKKEKAKNSDIMGSLKILQLKVVSVCKHICLYPCYSYPGRNGDLITTHQAFEHRTRKKEAKKHKMKEVLHPSIRHTRRWMQVYCLTCRKV